MSVLSRWSVSGYPNTGPQPNPCGLLVLAALVLGLFLCTFVLAHVVALERRIARDFLAQRLGSEGFVWLLWTCVGGGALTVLYLFDGWTSFAAGLLVAVFAMSVWRPIFELVRLSANPWRAIVIAALVYLVEIFYSVWTVAYNFVPGGTLTREFSGVLVAGITCCVGAGLWRNRASIERNKKNEGIDKLLILLLMVGSVGMAARYCRWQPGGQSLLPQNINELLKDSGMTKCRDCYNYLKAVILHRSYSCP